MVQVAIFSRASVRAALHPQVGPHHPTHPQAVSKYQPGGTPTIGNLPYGASKGALDRITLAAARELAPLGVTAGAVNPGRVDTGWMTDRARETLAQATPLGRLGTPRECAHRVAFLCSSEGGWINGQLLYSNGGLRYVPGTGDT